VFVFWLVAIRLLSLIVESAATESTSHRACTRRKAQTGIELRRKGKENHVIKKLTAGAVLETAWAIGVTAGPILPPP
jgi:hypothetical protein